MPKVPICAAQLEKLIREFAPLTLFLQLYKLDKNMVHRFNLLLANPTQICEGNSIFTILLGPEADAN